MILDKCVWNETSELIGYHYENVLYLKSIFCLRIRTLVTIFCTVIENISLNKDNYCGPSCRDFEKKSYYRNSFLFIILHKNLAT